MPRFLLLKVTDDHDRVLGKVLVNQENCTATMVQCRASPELLILEKWAEQKRRKNPQKGCGEHSHCKWLNSGDAMTSNERKAGNTGAQWDGIKHRNSSPRYASHSLFCEPSHFSLQMPPIIKQNNCLQYKTLTQIRWWWDALEANR